tara:strand:+ start:7755 stop:10526 length:2772 start_codon:yes stop_codon:yes gene_type:complete
VLTTSPTLSVAENATAVTTLASTDADGDTLIYRLTGGTDQALFALDANSGVLTFTSAPNFETPADADDDNVYHVDVTADDGQGGTTAQTLAVTVTDVNEAPTLGGASSTSVAENTTGTVYTASGNDPDNDALIYTLSGADAALFSLDTNSGALSFNRTPDFEDPADNDGDNVYDLALTASDGSLSSTAQALAISVTDANDAPVFTSSPTLSVAENATAVTILAATDAEGDTLSYRLTGGADQALFSLDANSGALTFTSAPNFEAPADSDGDNVYDIDVTADDGQGGTSVQTLAVTVTNVNEAPTLGGASSINVAENTTGTVYTATGNDPDNDALTYALSGTDAALFSLDTNSGALSFNSTPDFENPADSDGDNVYDLALTASDGRLSSTAQALTISVTNANDAPVFTSSPTLSVAENKKAITTLAATDADGDTLSYRLTGGADQALFSLDANSGALTFTSAPNFEAPADSDGDNIYNVDVTADDGKGGATAQTLAVTVTNVNESSPNPDPIQVEPTTPDEPQPSTPSGQPTVSETITNTSSRSGTAKLVENSGNANEVTATLPGGVSLVNQGARTAIDPQLALADLINSIDAQQPANLSAQTGVAGQWLANRPEGTLLDIRTLVISDNNGNSTSTPIQITGIGDDDGAGNSHQEAFVIDVRSLSQGNQLQLDNIDFASIVGATTIRGGAGDNVVIGDDASQYIVLGAGDDELHGGGGNDTIGSEGGDDRLFGDSGDDELFGGAGADLLHGGSDTDTVSYEGNRDDYVVTQEHSVITVQSKTEPEDIDTLINIETLTFADDELALSYDEDLAWITGLYAQVLGRQADVEGVQYWAQQSANGVSRADMALSILNSEESGRLVQEDDDYLDLLYTSLLGREADESGKAYWSEQMAEATLSEIVDGFMFSDEMRSHDLDSVQWDFLA